MIVLVHNCYLKSKKKWFHRCNRRAQLQSFFFSLKKVENKHTGNKDLKGNDGFMLGVCGN